MSAVWSTPPSRGNCPVPGCRGAAYKNLSKVIDFLARHGAKADVWNRKNKYGWTPLVIAEGHRPGDFKPSAETVEALRPWLPPCLRAGATRGHTVRP